MSKFNIPKRFTFGRGNFEIGVIFNPDVYALSLQLEVFPHVPRLYHAGFWLGPFNFFCEYEGKE